MEYCCRKLSAADLESVMNLNRDFREDFICRKNAEVFLKNPMNWLYAAVRESIIIGFAYGYELERLNDIGNMLYIHEIGVKDEFQRRGVGYRLMSELKEECRAKGICRYFLTAYQNNEGANALYRKLGGVVSDESLGNDVVYHFHTAACK